MKKFKLLVTRDYRDIESGAIRRKGTVFETNDEVRVKQLLDKEDNQKVVELLSIIHDE